MTASTASGRAISLLWRAWDALRRDFRTERAKSHVLLFVIFAGLAFYKLTFTRYTFDTHPDGGYYTNIAANVRDGRGLVTNLCLLHKGCPTMPADADIYPLWPLIYGYVARLFPLVATGKWLATCCYFLSLFFGYLWGSKMAPGRLISWLPVFGAGHVLVLMLGLNKEFFKYTTHPYTDGLATLLVLVTLWRACSLWAKPTWHAGLQFGVLLALSFLARKQTFVLALAAGAVFAGAVLFLREHRKSYAIMAASTAAAFCAVVSPHYFHLRSFVPNFGLTQMLRWDQTRLSDALTPVPILREVHGTWPYVVDRWSGFPVAFAREGPFSYRDHMYYFQYALPAALVLLAWLAVRHARPAKIVLGWRRLRRPESLGHVFAVVFALGAFLSMHTMHMYSLAASEWLFGGRWAIPCIYLFYLSMVLLLRTGVVWRLVAGAILCASVYEGGLSVREMARAVEGHKQPAPPAIAHWLNKANKTHPGLIVADRRPQSMAYMTPGVSYHWYHDATKLADVEAMVTKLGVDYVLVRGNRASFMRARGAFDKSFKLKTAVRGITIYEPTEDLLRRREAERASP